jgi:glycine hydroxymethyltransferase
MHLIAAKAIALREAGTSAFQAYARAVVDNAAALARALAERGLRIVSGGTDNHLMLVDVSVLGLSGAQAESALGAVNVTCNKNLIPYDTQPPLKASGIRLGTAAVTSRGLGRSEILRLAGAIADVLHAPADEGVATRARGVVYELTEAFPIRGERRARQAALRGS